MKFFPAILMGLALVGAAQAEVKPASVFSDHMVLQRDQPVPVWGTASPGEKALVEFAGQTKIATADAHGKWRVTLDPMPACAEGRPLRIGATTLADVLVGEVWLASGQSNMEMTLQTTRHGKEVVAQSAHPTIRLLLVPRSVQPTPQDSIKAKWAVCGPESSGRFSAVAYYFGVALQEKLKVPIGLIASSVGGSAIQQWTRDGAQQPLYRDGKYAVSEQHKKFGGGLSHLYNGMIAPLTPFAIRGVIWYQGESNVGEAAVYDEMLRTLVRGWRDAWGGQPFPFYFTQLAPRDYKGPGAGRPLMSEAMQRALDIPHSGMALTCDYGRKDNTHPLDKQPVGERLARLALHNVYGMTNIVCHGPVYRAHTIEGNKVRITFDHAHGGLKSSNDKPLTFFEVAGSDNVYHTAKAEIAGPDSVLVWSEAVPTPTQVRFAWHDVAGANLVNGAGLPALCFRTDKKCPPPLKYDWPADMGGLD